MKTVLAIFGVLGIILVIGLVGGGYFLYKKSSSTMIETSVVQIDQFIVRRHPGEPMTTDLRRIENGLKLNPSWSKFALMGPVMMLLQSNGSPTPEQLQMLDAAAQLAEQNEITKAQLNDFTKHYSVTGYYQPVPQKTN